MPDGKVLITGASPRGWHRLQLAAQCLQLYAYTYEYTEADEGFGAHDNKSSSPPLIKGSLMHLVLAQHYARMREVQNGGNINEWEEPKAAVAWYANEEGKDYIKQVALIHDTYDAYIREYPWSREIKTMRITHVEDLMDVNIQGYRLTGRLDLGYEDLAGRFIPVDTKTSGRVTKAHAEYYSVHGQLYGYHYMAKKSFGEDKVHGFQVNLVQLKPGDPKFNRINLDLSPEFQAQFEQVVVDIEHSIEYIKKQNRPINEWPKAMNELSCYTRYGKCPFWNRCREGPGANNWRWVDETEEPEEEEAILL